MQIEEVARQQDAPQLDTAHSLAAISFRGVQRNNPLSLVPVLRQNIEPWLTQRQSLHG
jgi:hypothetical protein